MKAGNLNVYATFGNDLLNAWLTTCDLFVIVSLFVRPKACGCAHIVWSWHKRSEERANEPKVKHQKLRFCDCRATTSNVEIENIGSVGFTQCLVVKTVKTSKVFLIWPILVLKSKVPCFT